MEEVEEEEKEGRGRSDELGGKETPGRWSRNTKGHIMHADA